jgi:Mrp family chromosome partitioning ATPase
MLSSRTSDRFKTLLEKTSCPILGVILNKVDSDNQGYGKYGSYGQYGRYGRYGQVVEKTDKT